MSWRRQKVPHRKKRVVTKYPHSYTLYAQALEHYKPKYVIGLDEVGYGAIVSDVVLGCTVYVVNYQNPAIKDSKAYTTEKARQAALVQVQKSAKLILLEHITPGAIDVFGFAESMQAGLLSLANQAVAQFPESLVVMDGKNQIKHLEHPQLVIPGADSVVLAVSAASIAAKVARDNMMHNLDKLYPEYEWHNNKGYATPKHLKKIEHHGVCKHHRRNIDLVVQLEKKYGTYEEKKASEAQKGE